LLDLNKSVKLTSAFVALVELDSYILSLRFTDGSPNLLAIKFVVRKELLFDESALFLGDRYVSSV
jgi:hypothetical protein